MQAMEEIPLVNDVEMSAEELEEPAVPRSGNLRKYGAFGGILGLMALAYFASRASGDSIPSENVMARVADAIGRSHFGTITVNGGQTQMGDGNSQTNIGGDVVNGNKFGGDQVNGDKTTFGGDQINAKSYVGKNKGTVVHGDHNDITNTVQAKKCEGSGNGVKGVGAAQVVCCYSPKGPGCCDHASTGGRRLGICKDLHDKFMTETDPKAIEALGTKIKMMNCGVGGGGGDKVQMAKDNWPAWAHKLPKDSTSGCPGRLTPA